MVEKKAIEQLQEYLSEKPLIIGIGNPMLGDDGAGPRLIELLQEAGDGALTLIDAGSAPERHFGEVEAALPQSVLLVDAVDFGATPGEIAFFDEESLPARACCTHDVSLRLVMQYLRMTTGAKVGLLGIQPAQIAFGAGLTMEVEATVKYLVAYLSAKSFRTEANLAGVGAWTQC
jgi:hydrogenase 3 maturation protease